MGKLRPRGLNNLFGAHSKQEKSEFNSVVWLWCIDWPGACRCGSQGSPQTALRPQRGPAACLSLSVPAPFMTQMVKNRPANAGDPGSIPGSGRSPGGGNGNPLQYSCLEISINRGAFRATVHGVAEPDTTELLTLPWWFSG